MDSTDFKSAASDMISYVTQYLDNIESRRVLPTVQPGYIKELIPDCAPEEAESWPDVLNDVERVIMPGVSE